MVTGPPGLIGSEILHETHGFQMVPNLIPLYRLVTSLVSHRA